MGSKARGATSRRSGGAAIALLPPTSPCAAEVEAAAERVERELGPIDIWVNNAMVSVFSPDSRDDGRGFKRVTEVTYLGYVHGTLAALRRMRPRDRGTIVQVGSALAYRSIPLQSAYCAAKHAVAGFTDSLRCELIHDRSTSRHDGADAGAEHAAVRLGEEPAGAQGAAGAADLPARGRRARDLLGQRIIADARCSSARRRSRRSSPTN